jgi:hypothetical protein
MTDQITPRRREKSTIFHVRMKPSLRTAIFVEAESKNVAPSELVRQILDTHFEGR